MSTEKIYTKPLGTKDLYDHASICRLEPNAIKHPSGSPSIPIRLRLHIASERGDAGPGSFGILVLYAVFSSMVS